MKYLYLERLPLEKCCLLENIVIMILEVQVNSPSFYAM